MTGITEYDSASFMLNATANYLYGREFQIQSIIPSNIPKSFFLTGVKLLNNLPNKYKISLSVLASTKAALQFQQLEYIHEEEIAESITAKYPRKKYQAIAIGSSNGALVHLYAALGIPWLPQTNLLLINRGKSILPDDMQKDAEWGEKHAGKFLEKNPKIQLHQMNDPAQDRFMAIDMSYFRIKFITLPNAYKKFIEDNLAPGGTIMIINCESSWPITQLHDRHFFQVGGYGGITIDEYLYGGKRVQAFLKKFKSPREKFILPKITGKYIEAEWGFEKKLMVDIQDLAKKNHYTIDILKFQDPEDATIPISELYQWWYSTLNRPTDKILFESFLLLDSYMCLVTGCIPYWSVFTGTPSYLGIKKYLSENSFNYIYMTLFSNMVESIGTHQREEWEALILKAKKQYAMIAVDTRFPYDMRTPYIFFSELKKQITFRYPVPQALSLESFRKWINNKSYKNFSYKTADINL